MRKFNLSIISLLMAGSVWANMAHRISIQIDDYIMSKVSEELTSDSIVMSRNDSIIAQYTDSLSSFVEQLYQSAGTAKMPSPYYFRLFGPGTLYNSVLSQNMSGDIIEEPTPTLPSLGDSEDSQLQLSEAINEKLAQAYVQRPQLFSTTQSDVMSGGKLRSDLQKKVSEDVKLSKKVAEAAPEVKVEVVEAVAARPNFWKFKGNGGLQFTQSYFSKNWYQGGENNYSMLALLTLDANYNNQRKIQWDNRFEAQLGFQTSESNSPKFRPTSNLLRLTSNLGIKAIGNWNYSAQLQLQSQPYVSFNGSSKEIVGDFLSPLYVRSSIGMDYNIKKKRFTGKLHLAPLSYVITYVKVDSRVTRYGIDPGHNSKHEWGPNVDFTFDYKIAKNISWHSRFYWFSNFKLTRIENEHTINFTVNKYISAKLFMYPRFEDAKYYNIKRNADGSLADDSARETYWMFKEFLSLGLNYDF
ncbi:MAG: DUF3078 domain-containing protein [Bacteroidaceae bacterium]|nr:DUF3078 domain-containing protein [Bacteroidaceae bacterium]